MSGVRGSWTPALAGTRLLAASLPWGMRPWPRELTPGALLCWRAAADPDRAALVDDEGELTYRGLVDAVAALAGGLPVGDTVVLTCTRTRPLVVGLLAALTARCRTVVVPRRAGTRTLEEALRARPGAVLVGDDGIAGRAAGEAAAPAGPAASGLLFATSGTTGTPKLAPAGGGRGGIVPASTLALLGVLAPPRRPLVRCLAGVDHGHGAGVLAATLALGGTFLAADGARRVDVLTGVPVQLLEYAAKADPGRRAGVVLSGSDRLTDADADLLASRFGARVLNAYGATEIGTISVAGPRDRRLAPGTVGRPVAGVRVDAVGGRLRVRTLGGRVFSGDAGHVDDRGYLHVTGRADGVRVSGGENYSPDALSSWLGAISGVTSVRLAEEPDARFGSRVVAELRLAEGVALEPEGLRARIRAELGPASVPARIVATGDEG